MSESEETRERVNAGAARAQTQLDLFYDAMAHELEANAHKGQPADQTALLHVTELFYHAAKLYMAVRFGAREAALEYAADCGNHAWMAAEAAHVLDPDLLTTALEGATSGIYAEDADGSELDGDALERALRETPWIFKEARGGFYNHLKSTILEDFVPRLDTMLRSNATMHGRRAPEPTEALGAKR